MPFMAKTKATALKALSGNLFDKEYAKRAGVGDHESTVKLLQKIQKDGKDSDLKALADKMLPTVEHHLDMPSNAYARLGLPEKPLADVVLGNLHGASCGAAFVDIVGEAFRRHGYTVALNDPYAGQDLVRTFGRPALGQHSLQIEINRGLYLNETTREPKRQFPELRKRIHLVLQAIADYIREETIEAERKAPLKDTT